MEKMTNSKALAFVLANAELPADVREKIENIKASIDKKNSAERKPTATQTEKMLVSRPQFSMVWSLARLTLSAI